MSGLLGASLTLPGCASPSRKHDPPPDKFDPPQVLVVAPVVNLSGAELDTLEATDTLTAEFLAFRGVTVVPVNLTLAALARRGKTRIESPADARALAHEFNADAAVVTAITHYDPYYPPRIGLVMQWYAAPRAQEVLAPDAPSEEYATAEAATRSSPLLQVQRVYDASDEDEWDDVREFAKQRDKGKPAYGWRRYLRSQELFMRYCCGSAIRTMKSLHSGDASAFEAE